MVGIDGCKSSLNPHSVRLPTVTIEGYFSGVIAFQSEFVSKSEISIKNHYLLTLFLPT